MMNDQTPHNRARQVAVEYLHDRESSQTDDTIDVAALTEEFFAGEIDSVANEYDMSRDGLAKMVASDLGFWIPTGRGYVDGDCENSVRKPLKHFPKLD